MQALTSVRNLLLGFVSFAALAFFLALWIMGLAWIAENVGSYLDVASAVAILLCFVLLPLALIRATRKLAVYGLFMSSMIFGLDTWTLGFLATLKYWGVTGVIGGIVLGVVGIVPLGILASAFHTDWPAVGMLALGLVLTIGARAMAIMLAAMIGRDQATAGQSLTAMYSAKEATNLSQKLGAAVLTFMLRRWNSLAKNPQTMKSEKVKRQQIIVTLMMLLVLGGLAIQRTLNPAPYDHQAAIGLQSHPIASILGALLPTVILAPFAYWMFGGILRRNAARFKNCFFVKSCG